MAYLYRHIRLDKNEVFYIGIGTDEYFFRSKDTKRRNKHWQNIINITSWDYEILYIDNNISLIKEKEIEFIKLYGRKIDGGTLCNLTMGGEGTLGLKPVNSKKCFGLDPKGKIHKFNSITEASNYIDSNIDNIPNIINIFNGKKNHCKGWRFAYEESTLFKPIIDLRGKNKSKPNNRSVIIYGKSPEGFIKEFINPYYAAKEIGSYHTLVRKVAKGKSSHTKGWVFSYDKEKL